MKYLVLGAGLMGYASIFDLINSDGVEKLSVIELNQKNLDKVRNDFKSNKLHLHNIDINDKDKLIPLMKEHNTILSSISYRYNYWLSELAIETNCNFCDLGGNNDIVDKQYLLHEKAKAKGVTIIPDCGLAPGMASNLAALAVDEFDVVESLKLRVGGLPQKPEPPMNYSIFFSAEGLVNEYFEPPILFRNNQIITGEPLGDLESLSFPGFPELEAFNTSGGISTLPKSFAGKVLNMDYKTIRYKGHRDQCKLLFDLGLMNTEPVDVKGHLMPPRDLLMTMLYKKIPYGAKDVVLVRVEAQGQKDTKQFKVSYEIIDYYDEKNNISAMMRLTAYPQSIIAQMMGRGEVKGKGVLPSELIIDNQKLVNELKARNINIAYNVE